MHAQVRGWAAQQRSSERTHGGAVPGQERAQVDDLAADAILLLYRLRLCMEHSWALSPDALLAQDSKACVIKDAQRRQRMASGPQRWSELGSWLMLCLGRALAVKFASQS